ncbi:NUP50 (Nucleoporin 50 kDa) domain-containing protein [Phthorimaea operculella]|nr:NUP50 (Nucleoporin 50 kDa) domain-containing protein [Phthorimaea operculella]
MSIKRQATTELNHDNWDQEDPAEQEEMGMFKAAPKDVLEKRVIKTAKRRNPGLSDEAKKSVFSGFGGFNKTQPSSFDFLANLTNGNKTNGTATSNAETPASSGLFSSKPATSTPGTGLFSTAVTSTPASKPVFGSSMSSSSMFGGSSTTLTQSPFGSTQTKTTAQDSPFKMQTISSSNNTGNNDALKSTNNNTNSPFGTSSITNDNTNKASPIISKTITANNVEKKNDAKSEDKKMVYYTKLKGLNESVSDWIKKHVEETPLCILSPIFKDYEKHLKEIQEEYEGKQEETKKPSEVSSETKSSPAKSNALAPSQKTENSLFSNSNSKSSLFSNQNSTPASSAPSGFSFGVNTSSTSTTNTPSAGFSFGVNSTPQTTSAPSTGLFSFAPKTTTTAASNGPAPFSFSSDKPFSFSSNIAQQPANTEKDEKEDEDEPPKVEFTPVVEENSVFDKKCKIFVKKDGNFIDKGVGTLYIKKVEENNKHQLLVRANTNLGTILLNLILSSSIPTQRLGKNNVMLACIPTPDAKPPPTPVLIRVKTSEEADELLETLNKYKV